MNSQKFMFGNLVVQICRTTSSQLSKIYTKPTSFKELQDKKIGDFKAQDKLNKQIVVLRPIKQEKEVNGFPQTVMRAIHLLSSIKHENIVSFQKVVNKSSKEKAVIMYREHLFGLGLLNTDLHNLMQRGIVFNLDQVRCLILEAYQQLYFKANNILQNDKGYLLFWNGQ